MTKYRVTLVEKVRYYVDVEAGSEEEADELAEQIWAESADPTHDFCGEGEGVTVYLTLEVGDAGQ